MGDKVALLVGHQTCDSQVVGLSPGWAPPCSGQWEPIYTCMPLSPRGSDALQLGS